MKLEWRCACGCKDAYFFSANATSLARDKRPSGDYCSACDRPKMDIHSMSSFSRKAYKSAVNWWEQHMEEQAND